MKKSACHCDLFRRFLEFLPVFRRFAGKYSLVKLRGFLPVFLGKVCGFCHFCLLSIRIFISFPPKTPRFLSVFLGNILMFYQFSKVESRFFCVFPWYSARVCTIAASASQYPVCGPTAAIGHVTPTATDTVSMSLPQTQTLFWDTGMDSFWACV